jgi:cell division protein FtsB
MSRSAVARQDRARVPRRHAPAVAWRRSGPARPAPPPRARAGAGALTMSEAALAPDALPRPRVPFRPPLRLAAGGASLVLRIAEATLEVSGSRTMDRLVRSRAWVVIIGFGLIGIVAMQVSMLKLNNGIGRAVETAATLERSNATLRNEVSRLSSGDLIQARAGTRGFVMPEPGDVTYLRAGALSADGLRAARRMSAPDPQNAGPAGLMTVQNSVSSITGTAGATTAPATDPAATPATDTTGAVAPTTTAPPAPAAPGDAAPAPAAPATAAAPQPGAATATPTAPATTAPVTTPSGEVTIP